MTKRDEAQGGAAPGESGRFARRAGSWRPRGNLRVSPRVSHCAGFALVTCWVTCLLSLWLSLRVDESDTGDVLTLETGESSAPFLYQLSFLAAFALAVVVLVLLVRIVPLSERREAGIAIGACGSVGTGLLAAGESGSLPAAASAVGACLAGAAAAWLILVWEEYLAAHGVREALLRLGASMTAGLALAAVVIPLPDVARAAVLMTLPVAGMATLRPEPGTRFFAVATKESAMTSGDVLPMMLRDHSPRLLCLLALMAAAQSVLMAAAGRLRGAGALNASGVVGWALDPGGQTFMLVACGAVCCLALWRLRHDLLSRSLYVAVVTSTLGVFAFATHSGTGMATGLALLALGSQLAYLMVWIEMVQSAQVRRLPMAGLFALLLVVELVGACAGQIVEAVWPLRGDAGLYSLCLAPMAMLVFAALLLASLASSLTVSEELLVTPEPPDRQERVLRLAKLSGLTPRETEVLRIWVAGHNAAYIEEQLHISRNTVKSHLNHIYQKTGVTSREELLALLDR
jgi:DNA-binding CsgD family transcriptional regulator